MKRIMKRNQVVITALAVMLAVAGYLTYAGKQDLNQVPQDNVAAQASAQYDTYSAGTRETSASAESEETPKTGEDGTESEEGAVGEQGYLEDINSLDYDIDEPGEAVLANGVNVTDYLASAKLSREQVRGKNREELLKIIDDDTADALDRQAAVDKMVELTDNSDKECAAETLLGAKGFENSIVSITDGKVDVVICREELSDAQLAQIEDIVKRKTDADAAQIVISLVDMEN